MNGTKGSGATLIRECEKCGSALDVIDSRPTALGWRRRRICRVCNVRFSTTEIRHSELEVLLQAETELKRIQELIKQIVA